MLHQILVFGSLGIAAISALGAALSRPKRGLFILNTLAAAAAALAAQYHSFAAFALFALSVPWILFCTLPYMDLAWRAKVGLVIFLTLGSAVCIYPTYHDERYGKPELGEMGPEERAELERKAKEGELGLRQYVLANIPFRLVRGLDLKGGLRLVYTVDVDEAIKDKRDAYYDEMRSELTKAMGFFTGEGRPPVDALAKLPEKAKVEKSREHANELTVTFNDPADAKKIDEAFLKRFITELTVMRSSDEKVITFRIKSEVETQIRDRSVAQAKDTVQRRVDGYGVKEVSLTSRDEDIILEIPGKDKKTADEIREIVQQTARLEFKMVDDEHDFFEAYARDAKLPEGLRIEIENAPLGPSRTKPVHYAFMQRKAGEDMRLTLKRLKDWAATLQVSPDNEVSFAKVVRFNAEKNDYEDEGWRTYYLNSKADVTGDMIRDAQAAADQSDRGMGRWLVQLEFTQVGGERFEDVTGRNVKKRFAIVLDEQVESAPVIQTKIGGGHGVITMGAGNQAEQLKAAKKLELVLRAGALPAPIAPSYEQEIGPSLGNDAIQSGLKGGAAGTILVLLFMWAYYSRAGLIANIAVLFNLVLQVAILAMLNASMTLPGIAGLVLTIGIAVDANVLINERIRDELRHGKSARQAVDVGYDKAFSAILDGHVTTLISSIILWQFGTGPVKGFAVTLFFGIVVSLFTGVVCTRLMFDWVVRGRKAKKLYLGQPEPKAAE